MPRKPRIEIAGHYHIMNRGVGRRIIFKEEVDYQEFEKLMCFHAKNCGITIHNYCLMSNHYHLLIEIQQENLSKFMRQLNMNYAIYFNKKYKRAGHLWQGRFKSWLVTDEAYLYTLMLYIEQNPIKAKIVERLEEYPYSSYNYFISNDMPECLNDSWIVENHKKDREAIKEMLNSRVDYSELQELKRASSLMEAPNIDKKPNEKRLRKMFKDITDIKKRNKKIVKVYEKGYSQHLIAKVLGLNQATVNRIIKRTK